MVYRGLFVYWKSSGSCSLTLDSVEFEGVCVAAGKVLLHVRTVIDGSTGAIYPLKTTRRSEMSPQRLQ